MITTTDYIIVGVLITTTIVSLLRYCKQQIEITAEEEKEFVNKLLERRRLKGLRKYVDD